MSSFNFFREGRKASQLQRSEQEDFSFNGKTSKGALLYGEIPFGGKINANAINTKPTNSGRKVAWHPSGRLLAVGHDTTPRITVYYFSGTNLVKIPNPATLPEGTINAVSWSPDGKYLAVLSGSAPNTIIYSLDLTGSAPSLALVTSNSDFAGFDLSWSPDSKHIAFTQASFFSVTPIKVYSFDGTSLTLSATEISPSAKTGVAICISWSPSGKYIAVGCTGDGTSTQIRLTVYIFNGASTILKVLDVSGTKLPDGQVSSVTWSPTEQYISVSHTGGYKSTVYKYTPPTGYSGQLIEKLSPSGATPGGDGLCTAWSTDGRHYAVGLSVTPYLAVYSVEDGELYYVLYNYAGGAPPEGAVRDISWSPNGKFVAVVHDSHPHITVYTPGTGTISPGNMVEIEPPSNLPHI